MFLQNINWRHIVGALVTGLILQVAGIINLWIFLGLVAMGITISLAQYLPVARRTVTAILVIGIIATIGIPTVHHFVGDQWPQTAKAIKKQNKAADLKGYETLNQPGLIGIAEMRKLAEKKEQNLTALALRWFERAAQLHADGKFAEAEAAEKSGRHNLNLAIEAREADAQYIKDKLSKVKIPAGWRESIKNFFTDSDFVGALEWAKNQGFSLRLLILGVILLLLGTLLLRRLSKGFGGAVVLAGCVALVWAMFLLLTPELAPNPTLRATPRSAASVAAPVSGIHEIRVALQPGQWSAPINEPRGAHKYFFRGPKGTRVKFADGVEGPVTGKFKSPTPLRFYNATSAGEVVVIFKAL